MTIHPRAGTPAPAELLVDVGTLRNEYHGRTPDVDGTLATREVRYQRSPRFVAAGHVHRSARDRDRSRRSATSDARSASLGRCIIGRDTHALSEPAFMTALEVLAANGVEVMIDSDVGYTPTPAISHAILTHNRGRTRGLGRRHRHHAVPQSAGGWRRQVQPAQRRSGRDGSHSMDRGAGQPAARWRSHAIPRMTYERARRAVTTHTYDYVGSYVSDLATVVDLDIIRRARSSRLASIRSAARARPSGIRSPSAAASSVEVVNDAVDPTFRFMPLDWDGKIRMDCSSPYAMATLIGLKDRFDIAFGNDADADRHGIVTHAGLMKPNHYLAAAISYLFTHRPRGARIAAVGKTHRQQQRDRSRRGQCRPCAGRGAGRVQVVRARAARRLARLWRRRERRARRSCGATARVWTSDKDGIILGLLAAEIMARTSRDPSELFARPDQ